MIDTNTNKIIWVAMAVGVVAILGLGTMTIFPDALSTTQTQITKMTKSFNDKTKDISNNDASSTNGADKNEQQNNSNNGTSENQKSDTSKDTNNNATSNNTNANDTADNKSSDATNKNTNDSAQVSDSSTSSDANKNTTTPAIDNTPKETTTQVGVYTVTTDSTGYSSYTVDNSKVGFKYNILSNSEKTVAIKGGGVIGYTLTIPDYLIINGTKYKVTTIESFSYFSLWSGYSDNSIVINHIAKTVTSIGTDAFTGGLLKGQSIYVNRQTGSIDYLTKWGSYSPGMGMNAPFKNDEVTIKYYD